MGILGWDWFGLIVVGLGWGLGAVNHNIALHCTAYSIAQHIFVLYSGVQYIPHYLLFPLWFVSEVTCRFSLARLPLAAERI